MISKVRLQNFKSLKNISLELKDLNIITGINGVGKSTLIQSLLLIRQSFLKNQYKAGISLDGELTGNLGSIKDIENRQSDSGFIEISINDCNCIFDTLNKRDETLLKGKQDLTLLEGNALLSQDKFQYIAASRISPDSQFTKDTYGVENKQFGKNGAHVVSYISEVGSKNFFKEGSSKFRPLISLAVDEKGEKLPLINQINHWLSHIANDVRLDIVKTTNTKYELNYEFYNGTTWDSHSASNSAFGLTYSLPVITALLSASTGDIVVIENPESDLHPAAQSKLGELIARCANEGVQIIIETHSDHILNGIRVAISSKPTLLAAEKVKVMYFYKEIHDTFTKVKEIEIDFNGRMPIKELQVNGIKGFFDQIDFDYRKIYENINAKI